MKVYVLLNWTCSKDFDWNSIWKKSPNRLNWCRSTRKWWNQSEPCHHASILKGTGLTLEGALPSDQDCQPKPAKRARTSFTAEQLQVYAIGSRSCLLKHRKGFTFLTHSVCVCASPHRWCRASLLRTTTLTRRRYRSWQKWRGWAGESYR